MKPLETFIHIGYPKTGTTFLQNNFFPNIKGINYLDHSALHKTDFFDIYNNCLDYNPEKIRNDIETLIPYPESPILISYEGLTGAVFNSGMNTTSIAQRLHELQPNLRIIITIRNQVEMIDSLYRQYIYQGGTLRLSEFLKSERTAISFDFSYLDYFKLISFYQNLFGASSINVVLYEELKENSDTFLKKWLNIMGVADKNTNLNINREKSNPGISDFSINSMRYLNHFLSSWANPNAIIPKSITSTTKVKNLLQSKIDPKISKFSAKNLLFNNEELINTINQHYSKSNKKLINELNINIDKYQYIID